MSSDIEAVRKLAEKLGVEPDRAVEVYNELLNEYGVEDVALMKLRANFGVLTAEETETVVLGVHGPYDVNEPRRIYCERVYEQDPVRAIREGLVKEVITEGGMKKVIYLDRDGKELKQNWRTNIYMLVDNKPAVFTDRLYHDAVRFTPFHKVVTKFNSKENNGWLFLNKLAFVKDLGPLNKDELKELEKCPIFTEIGQIGDTILGEMELEDLERERSRMILTKGGVLSVRDKSLKLINPRDVDIQESMSVWPIPEQVLSGDILYVFGRVYMRPYEHEGEKRYNLVMRQYGYLILR